MSEQWKPIADWPNYEISDTGRVRRAKARRRSAAPGVGDLLRPFAREDAYLTINLTRDAIGGRHEQKRCDVHRLVVAAFLGPIPAGMEVNHKDLNKHNPRLDNLEVVTRSANLKHAYRHGRIPHLKRAGHQNSNTRLTSADVIQIRWRAAFGEKLKHIRAQFGLGHAGISHIVHRRTWRHLTGFMTNESIEVISNGR